MIVIHQSKTGKTHLFCHHYKWKSPLSLQHYKSVNILKFHFFSVPKIESSEKKIKGKKNAVQEGVREKIKDIIKNLKTKFKLEKTFFDCVEELAIESVEQEEQDLVEPEEHALVIVLTLLSLTCGEKKYRLYLNLIRKKAG